jgi:NADP-dependent alcohol dehydrogenase
LRNFTYANPVHILFGRGSIARLADVVPRDTRVMMLYGRGSIFRNGVYDQVKGALGDRPLAEFGGIEPNPRYETCLKAVDVVRRQACGFLLAVGGGSVLDGTKFIAAAARFAGADPWTMVAGSAPVADALPLGCVLTLPATGSEMNGTAVISRQATGQKLAFRSGRLYPRFSILDPEATFSLPGRQLANGIVDSMVHVLEQYVVDGARAPLQDRQAEAVLSALIERAPMVLAEPPDYDARADLMWCAANALNGLLACGVTTDWAVHRIGHELTALHGIDHARTLAIVLPALWRYRLEAKQTMLAQYGRRVWSLGAADTERGAAQAAVDRTEAFFRDLGVGTRLRDYGLSAADCLAVSDRLEEAGARFGERGDMTGADARAILALAE